MKLAIFSVTARGACLADETARLIRQEGCSADCYAKRGRMGEANAKPFDSLSELVAEVWPRYDAFLFIMATGIVVRVIAPHIISKRFDPAVVVLDEHALHAISLLSGHLGQANRLTIWLAGLLGADPVITTATDLAGKVAPDVVAAQLNFRIEPFERMKSFNAALASGEELIWRIEPHLSVRYAEAVEALGVEVATSPSEEECDTMTVIISDRIAEPFNERKLFLRPPVLAVGVGCRRGTATEDIMAAIEAACFQAGRSTASIYLLASVDVKSDEQGLLTASEKLGAATCFYTAAELAATVKEYKLKESDFVRKQIGVGNICEAAVIRASQGGTLLVPRTRYPNITVALAEVASA